MVHLNYLAKLQKFCEHAVPLERRFCQTGEAFLEIIFCLQYTKKKENSRNYSSV